jgi:predicted ATPase
MAYRRLLLPLTGTAAGEAALRTAILIARIWHSHVHCLHVRVDARDVADGLAALAERSLLQVAPPGPEGEPRYRMLETLREYGVEQMTELGELERVRTAHARHVAVLRPRRTSASPSAQCGRSSSPARASTASEASSRPSSSLASSLRREATLTGSPMTVYS